MLIKWVPYNDKIVLFDIDEMGDFPIPFSKATDVMKQMVFEIIYKILNKHQYRDCQMASSHTFIA